MLPSLLRTPHTLLALLWIFVLSLALLSATSSANKVAHGGIFEQKAVIDVGKTAKNEPPPGAVMRPGSAQSSPEDDSLDQLSQNSGPNKKRSTALPTEPRTEHVCHPPVLVKLNVVFDAIIALAYFSIPIEVAYFYHRHPTPQLFWVYVLFFSFIMLCGITHAIHALSPFELPTLHAIFKVLCGLVSIITAVYLVKFIPAALKLPNYTAYLEYEIQERQISEMSLRNKNEESKKLRTCTERLRQTLQVQGILLETTSSLCTQLELESCCFIRYNANSRSLSLVAPYTSTLNEDESSMPHSLRVSHSDAISAFHSIISGEHIRLLETNFLENLFGKQATTNYLNRRVATLQLSKSTVCSHVTFPDNEAALLLLLRPSDGAVWSVSEVELVRDVATQVEIALAQARSIERDKELLYELQKKNAELEQAQQRAEMATQAKSKFIAIMSHEMRTPLYVVTALTELLLDTQLNTEQRESLSTIQTSGRLLLAIISDVLDYSKFQQDNFVMDKSPFNIRTCIEKCVDIAGVKAHEAGLEVFYHLREGFPEVIDTDESRLSQVFLNLLSNAVKFTKAGALQVYGYIDKYLTNEEIAQLYKTQYAGADRKSAANVTPISIPSANASSTVQAIPFTSTPTHPPNFSPSAQVASPPSPLISFSNINTSFSHHSAPTQLSPTSVPMLSLPVTTLRNMPPAGTKLAMLHFIVRDSGVGIPNDQIPRLFEEFTQLDTSVSRKYEGSGLGLAICRRVVTLMGGSIWVNSTPGVGSDFHFTIIAKIPPTSIAQPLLLPTTGTRGLSAFLISSASPLQTQLSDFCRQMGMTLQHTSSFETAAKLVKAHPTAPSMILVDSSCFPKNGGSSIIVHHLNDLAPVLVIGDTTGLDLELETPQLMLPLRFKSFYYASCTLCGVPSEGPADISREKFIAEIMSAKHRRGSGSDTSDQSSSMSSHHQGHSQLARSPSANSLASNPSTESLGGGSTSSPRRDFAASVLSQVTGQSSHMLESMAVRGSHAGSMSSAHDCICDAAIPAGTTPETSTNPVSGSPRVSRGSKATSSAASSGIGGQSHFADSSLSSITPFEGTNDDFCILLVEDNVVCRKVCTKQLQRLGLERIDIAVNGQEALDRTNQQHYDIIMMDVMMPGVDGLSATRAIRQRGEANHIHRNLQPYIIAITASSMLEEGSREACLTAGMDDVVNKPIHLKALQEALKRYFTKHPDRAASQS